MACTDVWVQRLTFQHAFLTKAIDSLYWPAEQVRDVLTPRDGQTTRILDVGCGSGAWFGLIISIYQHLLTLNASQGGANGTRVPSC